MVERHIIILAVGSQLEGLGTLLGQGLASPAE